MHCCCAVEAVMAEELQAELGENLVCFDDTQQAGSFCSAVSPSRIFDV
jgi:hypothetical protein